MQQLKNILHQRGYSLIELLVVVVIFAIISLTSVGLFLSTVISNNKTTSATEVKQEGDQILNVLAHMIRNSEEVQSCTTGDSITLLNRDLNTSTFALQNFNGTTKIASNGAALSQFQTNSLGFTCSSVNGEISTVNVSFELQKGVVGVDQTRDIVTRTFATTIGLRTFK